MVIKKILSLLTAAAILAPTAIRAEKTAQISVSAFYSDAKKTITVEGESASGEEYVTVLISRYDADIMPDYTYITSENANDSIIAADACAIENGMFSEEKKVSANIPKGWYIITVGDGTDKTSKKIYIDTDSVYAEARNAFAGATMQNIGALIEKYCIEKPIVGFDVSNSIYKNNSTEVQQYFLSMLKENDTLDEMLTTFDAALALVGINVLPADERAAIIKRYADCLGVDLNGAAGEYLKDIAAIIKMQSSVSNGKISSLENFRSALTEATCVAEINKSSRDGIAALLQKYETILGINAADGAGKQSAVNMALAFKSFTTTVQIREAFENAVKNMPGSSSPSGGGTQTGGISAGGTAAKGGAAVAVAPDNSNAFSDIAGFEWAANAIAKLKKLGVANGIDSTHYEPSRNVKREEFVKMIIVAGGISIDGQDAGCRDVDINKWYAPYVNTAVSADIVAGIGDGMFGIGSDITRQDAACIIYRYLKMHKPEKLKDISGEFSDSANIAGYAKTPVSVMYGSGFVHGDENNNFRPKDFMNRAEAAQMIYNLLSQ